MQQPPSLGLRPQVWWLASGEGEGLVHEIHTATGRGGGTLLLNRHVRHSWHVGT